MDEKQPTSNEKREQRSKDFNLDEMPDVQLEPPPQKDFNI